MNGKMPLVLTLAAAAAFIAILLIVQPYSAEGSGGPYAKPAKRYIRAALRQDSVSLSVCQRTALQSSGRSTRRGCIESPSYSGPAALKP